MNPNHHENHLMSNCGLQTDLLILTALLWLLINMYISVRVAEISFESQNILHFFSPTDEDPGFPSELCSTLLNIPALTIT